MTHRRFTSRCKVSFDAHARYIRVLDSYRLIMSNLTDVEPELRDLAYELTTVDWYQLGVQLNVPEHILTQIDLENPGNESRKLTKLLQYWKRNNEASWEKIVEALQRIGGHKNVIAEIRAKYMSHGLSSSAELSLSAGEGGMSHEATTPISLEENLSKVPSQLLDSPFTDADIIRLGQCILHWRDLSPYLSLTPEEETRIVTSFPAASTSRQSIDMLRTWKEKWKTNATYR